MTFHDDPRMPCADMLAVLAAAGEPTRLRLLALLSDTELTVSELVAILGQSQPRISRHLKLLVDARLVERHREGAWVFLLVAQSGPPAEFARKIIGSIAPDDPILLSDRARLEQTRRARAEQAARYFASHAESWDRLRALHVAEETVESAILRTVGDAPIASFLDIGTGTGRMLELFAPRAERALGIDMSTQMLGMARARLERAELRNAQLRQGDVFALPVDADRFDLVMVHQVLHYLDDPVRALREAARVLRPGGRLIVADFAPHEREELRADHAHRRLGFAIEDIAEAMRDIGLDVVSTRSLAPETAGLLTVSIWAGRDRRIQSDALPLTMKEMA